MKILNDNKIFELVPIDIIYEILDEEQKYSKSNVLSKSRWGQSLRNYLLLTHKADRIVEIEKLPEVEKEHTVYLSRYYWLKKFLIIRGKEFGNDPGLQQLVFKILEGYSNIKGFSWDNIKKIDKMIDQELIN